MRNISAFGGEVNIRHTSFLFIVLVLVACSGGAVETLSDDVIQTAIAQTQVAQTSVEDTPIAVLPTNSPPPTNTPEPTDTPEPTNTPSPTFTPTPPPDPLVYEGWGDAVLDTDIDLIGGSAVGHIVGNKESNHFAVVTYDSNGEQVDLLVNTTDPYDGYVPINFKNDENGTRFEVNASGDWHITLYPIALDYARLFEIPGSYSGNGDDVIFLIGEDPDLATVKGNQDSHHFALISISDNSDLLINTTDPYDGTVIVDPDTVVFIVKAFGEWNIEVTSK